MKLKLIQFLALVFVAGISHAQSLVLPKQADRWTIEPYGSIKWEMKDRLPHTDHIEMSGQRVSLWVNYSVDKVGAFNVNRTVVFPTFRTLPDNTRSHISASFTDAELPRVYVNNRLLKWDVAKAGVSGNLAFGVKSVSQQGIMRVVAIATPSPIKIERSFFPSVDKPTAFERFVLTNTGSAAVQVAVERMRRELVTDSAISKGGQHTMMAITVNDGRSTLLPGQSTSFAVCYLATNTPNALPAINVDAEEQARKARVAEIQRPLMLETPDSILNTMFAFAKIRAAESIFTTKGGVIHSPGGLAYYAAIWANDQAEYVSPYFAFTGDRLANLSAMTCYSWFARYINQEYKPLPSSIVAEGAAEWHGAGDRGDQAMIAYGASRYALTCGNIDSARKLWPLISWCLEYSKRHLNSEGVVESKSDELEGRFPSGKANLSTNSLYYDALISAAFLAEALHQPKQLIVDYRRQAANLRGSIEKYFGGRVEGYATYKYYETNNTLRAWICLPLTVGINERAKGTIDALFSPRLWTADGLATEAGKKTFWDRSTLYALRGVLQAGETERAMEFLQYYSRRRLLGEHVPYPVEAWPEGNQRHLSAESGLYCRIFLEGLFGIRPTALKGFNCTPRLPKGWTKMALRNIKAFGNVFDLEVKRSATGRLQLIVKGSKKQIYKIKEGQTANVIL